MKWLSFRDRFVAMIDSSAELPPIAKLQYLLSSLKGDAALLGRHFLSGTTTHGCSFVNTGDGYTSFRRLKQNNGLTALADEFVRHVNGLQELHEPVDSWDTPLSNMLLVKLDNETFLSWEKQSVRMKEDKYSELIEFLQDRIHILKSNQRFACERFVAPIKPRRSVTNAASVQRNPHVSPAIQQARCALQCAEHHLVRNCP
uniref:Uncharacterized protein n=1 Tax=Anopheles christyi TaxID=43041 RepID=A0A182K661_9DIPT